MLIKNIQIKFFCFFSKAIVDNIIDDYEYNEFQKIILEYESKLDKELKKITLSLTVKRLISTANITINAPK